MDRFSVPNTHEYHRAINEAQGVFEKFYCMPSTGTDHLFLMDWPKPQGVLGTALAIGYWSDKFDKEWREYIHEHEKPYPLIVRQKKGEDKPVPQSMRSVFFKPKPPVWAFLGYVLDVQFDRGRGLEFLDWKQEGNKNFPVLGWDEKRKVLIIQPRTGEPPILIHSRILKVTKDGIEN